MLFYIMYLQYAVLLIYKHYFQWNTLHYINSLTIHYVTLLTNNTLYFLLTRITCTRLQNEAQYLEKL